MDELVAWLRAQVDEDERVAKAAVRWSEGASEWAAEGEPDWAHIARHDPARVLAEVAAKRRIIDRHPAIPPTPGHWSSVRTIWWCPTCSDADDGPESWPCPTIQAVASVYAGRPGWRSEWAANEEASRG